MVFTLAQVTAADLDDVGGKAFNCARLFNAGFPVPDGLVVDAATADSEIDQLPAHPWLAAQPAERRFAVRSSSVGEDGAGHSFAGIHETFLNVERDRVPEAIRKCRRSVASDQARAYRAARGLQGDARTGVLIQPMVDAEVSGVAFTVNPVTGADELLINSAPGLGEALVSGLVEPDEFRVRKNDLALLDVRPAATRPASGDGSLTEVAVRELSAMLVRIEQHYGAPQDVEWSREHDRLWILQSRPVTAAPTAAALTSDAPFEVDVEWSRANLAEVFPDQMSPQAVGAYEQLLVAGQRKFMGRMLGPESRLGPPFKAFGGRLYISISQLRHVVTIGGSPAASVLRSLGHADAIQPADEIGVRAPLREVLRCAPDLLRLARMDLRAEAVVREQDAENESSIKSLTRDDPRSLEDLAIWNRLMAWWSVGPERMQVILMLGSMVFLEDMLRKAARAAGQSYEALVYPHLAAGDASVSTQQAFDLVELAELARSEPSTVWYFKACPADAGDFRQQLAGSRFLSAFERFLERYGHRGLYESDYALPRYREDPSPLLFAIRAHLQHPSGASRESIARRLDEEARQAWAAFESGLTAWQRLTLEPRVRRLLARLKKRYLMREHCRSDMTRVVFHARQWHLTLADRFAERGLIARREQYFLLLVEEIDAVLRGTAQPSTLTGIVQARERQLEVQRALKMPLLMRQSEVAGVLAGTARRVSTEDGDRLVGLCVSRGIVEAEAVVIHDPREFQLMRRGAVLVAPATDPSWTPLFTLASGVIVEVGGILSHASTVAREYGLPALANVRNATTRLKTGDRILLDASSGVVQRLSSVQPEEQGS